MLLLYFCFFFLMIRPPPISTRTDTLFPDTTLFRSVKQGIACVRSSRSSSGVVTPSQADARRGLISGDTLNPQKARILLMLALTLSHDRAVIQSFFDRY